ncbi:MAG: hypothetical protein PVF60_04140 [Desulfobacterales bacterium]|jgi:hypothetical protein
MNSIQQFGNRLNTRYLILGLAFWWLAMLIVYSVITLRINHQKGKLRETGVEITKEFSKLVSLPLLERNSQSIHQLLTDAAGKTDVIYASVVDHRNKVVAFTGTGHLMPDKTETARSVDKVSMWEGGFASHARILNFASDITYADTKIGEIFIGLSNPGSNQTQQKFAIIAVVSSLILLFLAIIFRYQSIRTFLGKYINPSHSSTAMDSMAKHPGITCPLCGTLKTPSDSLFSQSNLNKFLATGALKHGVSDGNVADHSENSPHKLAETEDFSLIRRRIILRCTEIIKKLTA